MTQKKRVVPPPPYQKPDYIPADVYAMQALQAGTATAEQQTRALNWIIRHAANVYDVSYRPGGQEGDRDTAFAEGRRFTGLEIISLINIDPTKLRKQENERYYTGRTDSE